MYPIKMEFATAWIRRIRNWSNAFSCEVLALIRRISFAGYGVLVKIQQSSNIFILEGYTENYKNVLQDIRDQLNVEAKVVQIIFTGIDNDIYSTVDACPNACEMWKAIKRFYKMMNELIRNQCDVTNHQVNVQFLLQLQPEWQRFVTLVKKSQELKTASYHKLYDILKQHQNKVNEIRAERLAHTAIPLALVAQQQPVYHPQNHPNHYTQNYSTRSQPAATRNRGKVIINSPPPTYDQEPTMIAEDDEMPKENEIDKLMALISLSFKKIYKPTNNNLRISSNISRANQDNTLRINRGTGECCSLWSLLYTKQNRTNLKSSVEDLVRTPSESDGISEGECDLPVCDDSSPKKDEVLDDIISIPPGNGNDHFNAESSLIESVLNRDNVISSPKIDLLIEEFAGELALIAPIPPGIVEADLDPKGDIRFIENLMYDNSFPLSPETLKDDSETVIDSNNDYSLSDDDFYEDIDYVDASPPDFELVGLEEVKDFPTEDGEIEDDILCEKLSKINLLIAKIEALNTNPPPSSDFVTKSSSTSPNLFLEETNTLDNSLTESETFCFDLDENSIGSTTTRSDYSLPDYEAFYFDDDHIEDKSSGSTTTHSDISLSKYDSFIFDLSNDPFPPADRSDFYHEEFADELAHIISPPEYECFYFKIEPDPGELTSIVDPEIRENISSTTNVNYHSRMPNLISLLMLYGSFLLYQKHGSRFPSISSITRD
ncbi:hypothetical protein Tco_0969492 [Tanacetum coccineum]